VSGVHDERRRPDETREQYKERLKASQRFSARRGRLLWDAKKWGNYSRFPVGPLPS
jgi:hypothetical protein